MSEDIKAQYRVYYRLFYGIDAVISFTNLELMKHEIRLHKPDDFDYVNACYVCDDGSEEIIATGVEAILDIK